MQPDSVVNMQNRGIAHLSKQQVPEIMLICNVDAVAFFSVQPDSVVNMQNRGTVHLSKQQVPEIMLICNADAVVYQECTLLSLSF